MSGDAGRYVGDYIGRFAPSPTGPLHAGSLVAALASWLDARAHGGQWLVRIEDVDSPRCLPGMDRVILQQLAACGLWPDAEPVWQSQRGPLYQQALDLLQQTKLVYPCACSRKEIAQAALKLGQAPTRHGELVYPGTCRHGLDGKPARAWRLDIQKSEEKSASRHAAQAQNATFSITNNMLHWADRRLGLQQQNVAQEVGDFVLRRADGLWAYQLAVVVDDAAQGITHVVRGEDLADNTPRQILLQQALALATPHYLHTPLVLGVNGEKLSKQNGAQAFDMSMPNAALDAAAKALQLPPVTGSREEKLAYWIKAWHGIYNLAP
ncbi:tRNA glutamyl-Q(34) synthetase GluQRS [Variovorax sp. HJSM1_2]|uniref:tRNA glutamyl-Q(34) synthetase GluQRS n=1 Tax=Variovorax sp. HJSM1_2 TaxID=3366263 RepID=UPI003BC4AEB2